jgi:hypothetical protein
MVLIYTFTDNMKPVARAPVPVEPYRYRYLLLLFKKMGIIHEAN